ncbi:glycosyltransferase [Nocardia seriolae]|uniref:Glycogen(Starch) synthase n=1 Tax=Nocardia seriolae TaxID=37332 RepID=A0A0B8N2U3_9NOCA|nr:glycosyltransferase [Nocardia seriolae]APA96528.1 Glycogen(starch) synthase [Nocardia seriolae]MTJ61595.1 glycosyltransferase [Nocardia seriolae]MTJ71562.1 glycosyltransferase [Nocardia seriolae]MTJ86615.1 glycosyltransferase [Nocardia seriolae]MTK30610.1 glycosyltransferase [Nocardia seriolae]
MRILHLVTLVSPEGAYGGPVRVAFNQAAELRGRGDEVVVAAAGRGYDTPPTVIDGIPVRLFPARTLVPATGFAGLGAPGLWRWLRHNASGFDVVHIHLGRDLVSLPGALAVRHAGTPYVLQPHGMITPTSNPLAGPLDTGWTRKVLRDARAVCFLTSAEREALTAVAGPGLRLVHLDNGVPAYPPAAGARTPEVLFAARLHARKRPLAFAEMAKTLLANGIDANFTLIGPDEGEGPAVRAALGDDPRLSWAGPLDPARMPERMAAATVFVLPSVREPYPMAVLEAMSVGLPVVISPDCGLAPLVERTGSGIVTAPTAAGLAAAVRSLLTDPARARDMGARGRRAVATELGMARIGDTLRELYREATR